MTASRPLFGLLALFGLCPQNVLGQSLFNNRYVHAQYPAISEQFQPLPSGSTVFFGAGASAPVHGSIGLLDPQGQLVWERQVDLGGIGETGVGAVHDLGDGTLLCAVQGWYPSKGTVALVDTLGALVWSRDMGMPVSDVILTADGNCAAVGWRSVLMPGSDFDLHLTKLDLSGNMLWTKRYPEPGNLTGFNSLEKITYNMLEQPNGDLWLCFGYTDLLGVLCVNANGIVQWVRYFATGIEHNVFQVGGDPCALLPGPNGTWLFGKGLDPNGPGGMFAILIDAQGQATAGRSYTAGGNIHLRDVQRAPDGTYWMFAGMGPDHAFVHLDPNADLLSAFKLSDGLTRTVFGFGLGDDGAHLVSRALPDTSWTSAPHTRERFDPSAGPACDSMLTAPVVQGTMAVQTIPGPALAAAPGIQFASQALTLVPRIVTTVPECGSTGHVDASHERIVHPYPSPAIDVLHLPGSGPGVSFDVELTDALGRTWRRVVQGGSGLWIEDLPAGTYSACYRGTDGRPLRARFIKVDRP